MYAPSTEKSKPFSQRPIPIHARLVQNRVEHVIRIRNMRPPSTYVPNAVVSPAAVIPRLRCPKAFVCKPLSQIYHLLFLFNIHHIFRRKTKKNSRGGGEALSLNSTRHKPKAHLNEYCTQKKADPNRPPKFRAQHCCLSLVFFRGSSSEHDRLRVFRRFKACLFRSLAQPDLNPPCDKTL